MRLTLLPFLILTMSCLAAQADGEYFQVSPFVDYPEIDEEPVNRGAKVDRIMFFNYVGNHSPDFLSVGWIFPEKGALLGMENDGAGNFSKLPDESIGGARMHTARDFDIFDANGDGLLDIVLASEGTDQAVQPEPGDQSRLLIQKPAGGLEDVTEEKFPLGNHVVHSMTAGDIDGDGDIDLFMGHVGWCATCLSGGRLYLNDGMGKFTMTVQGLPDYVSDTSQAEVGIGNILTSQFLDVDGDGDLDLFLGTEDFARFGATPPERDILLLNDGRGSFLEDASQNLPLRPRDHLKDPDAQGSEAVDLDCDGDQDLMVWYTGMAGGQELQVWINDGTGHFTDFTDQWLGEELAASSPMSFGRPTDLNGDGWIDIALVATQSRILINVDGDHLVDVTAELLGDLANQEHWTPHPDDLDGDGDIDLFINWIDSYAVATNLKPLMPSERRCNADQDFTINAGHAGAWFNPDTSGQGQFIDVVPEDQFMFISWFTFTDAASDNPNEQHWYTAQGNYSGNTAILDLFETLGGKFDDPQEVTTTEVGEVTLSFSSCGQGQMSYSLDEEGLQGEFPLLRVIPGSGSVCEGLTGATTQTVDINAGMDGAWFDPDTSGQGYFIDAHPDPEGGNFIFVSWFTFGDATASGQRWLTAQGGFEGSIAEIDVFETTGGSFDDPESVSTTKVGTMSLDFTDCTNAQLTYSLPADPAEGDIAITRVIPGGQALCEELAGAE